MIYFMYLKFDIHNIVEAKRIIKWCPRPTCKRAVRLPDTEVGATVFFLYKPFFVQMMRIEEKGEVSHSVDCGNGHFFCWECLGEAHAPVACHKYQVVRSEHNLC